MKTDIELQKEGHKLKTYRKLLGLKQIEAAIILKTEQGNYCRMEQGRLNCGRRLNSLKKLFLEWRIIEIQRLKNQIEYLESL